MVTNAAEATEIVKAFVEKSVSPLGFTAFAAEKQDDIWVVQGFAAFNHLVFELDAKSGAIKRYFRKS